MSASTAAGTKYTTGPLQKQNPSASLHCYAQAEALLLECNQWLLYKESLQLAAGAPGLQDRRIWQMKLSPEVSVEVFARGSY